MVDPYLLTAKLADDSVLAYHTALELHGVAYSSFEQFTYLTKHKNKAFEYQNQRFYAVTFPTALQKRRDALFDVKTIDRQGIDIKITGIERTFVDVLDRIELSGGLEEVYRSISNIGVLNINNVIKYCLKLNNARLAAKVGYFLELREGAFAVTEQQLKPLLKAKPKTPQYLSQQLQKKCKLAKKWNLMLPLHLINKT